VSLPKASIIVPAYNEQNVIEDCLQALASQTHADFEAHFIDDCSKDSTKEIISQFVKKDTRFVLHEYGKVGPGKARNLTAKGLSSDVLVFTDADCMPSPTWLEELLKCFESSEVASAGGPQLCHPRASEFQNRVEDFLVKIGGLVDFYKPAEGGLRETRHNPLCNVAYRREVFETLGGFREDIFPGEDVEMDLRLRSNGGKILFNPLAIVFHHRPESIVQWRRVMRAYGRAQGKLMRERGMERKIQLLGSIFIATLVLLPIFLFLLNFTWLGLFFLGLLLGVFFIRPESDGRLSIAWNSFEWLNGFISGFVRNSSPPPDYSNQGINQKAHQRKEQPDINRV